jgi:hypothetical protein
MAENQTAPGPRRPLTPAEVHLEALATAALAARDPPQLLPVRAEIGQLEAQINAYRFKVLTAIDRVHRDLLWVVGDVELEAPADPQRAVAPLRDLAVARLREIYDANTDVARMRVRLAGLERQIYAIQPSVNQADAAFLRAPRAAQTPAVVVLANEWRLNGFVSFFPPGGACARLLPIMLGVAHRHRTTAPSAAHPAWVASAYLSADGTKLLETGPLSDHVQTPGALMIGNEFVSEVVDALTPP